MTDRQALIMRIRSYRRASKTVTLSRSKVGTFGIFLFLALMSVFMAIPLVYTILQSLKPIEEFYIYPPRFFVMNPTLDNYKAILNTVDTLGVPFTRYIFNAVFTTLVGTAVYLLLALITAYLASTMGIYLLVQFMRNSVPDSVLEAARIDGAGEFRILFSIVAPSVKAGWLTAMIFVFQSYWNAGSGSYIYSENLKHIATVMSSIAGSGITRAGTGMAVTIVLMIPTIVVFLWNQRSIMNTMAHSGLK